MHTEKKPKGTMRRAYRFPGEELAEPLAQWLRGPGKQDWSRWRGEFQRRSEGIAFSGNAVQDDKARTRITRLLSELGEVGRLFELLRGGRGPTHDGLRKFKAVGEEVNRLLRWYTSTSHPAITLNEPVLYGKEWRLMHSEAAGPFLWTSQGRGRTTLQEAWALRAVQELSRRGLLDRMRRCDVCKKWFFARKHFSLYCGADCRNKRYRHSPAYREWRSRRTNSKKGDSDLQDRRGQ